MKIGKKLFKGIKTIEGKKLKTLKKLAGNSPVKRLIQKGGAFKAAKTVLPRLFDALKKGGALKNDKVMGVVADLIGGAKNKKELAGIVKETLKGADQVLTIMPVPGAKSNFISQIGELAAKAQSQLAA